MLIQIPENYPVATDADMVIIYSVKLFTVIAFFYGMKYWISKTSNSIPVYITWVLGIWFLFYQSFTLVHGILMNLFVMFNLKMVEPRMLGVLALIIGVIVYGKLGKTITKKE